LLNFAANLTTVDGNIFGSRVHLT